MAKVLTEESKREILALHNQGLNPYQIAKRLKTSRSSIRWVIESSGMVPDTEDEPTQEEVDQTIREQMRRLPPWWFRDAEAQRKQAARREEEIQGLTPLPTTPEIRSRFPRSF